MTPDFIKSVSDLSLNVNTWIDRLITLNLFTQIEVFLRQVIYYSKRP